MRSAFMKTFNINLNEEHLGVINAALANGPYGAVAPVIAHINSEITRLYNDQYDKQREPKTVDHHPV
jgi:hypothetical protein